jgi:acetoacetate decarboxylase
VAAVLPPGLEPADEPRATAIVGRWQSNCVGDYEGGSISLAARHGDVEGDYVLAMYMSRDHPILFGRELFGEPKKHARVGLRRQGDRMLGWVERGGTVILEVAVELGPDEGASSEGRRTFNYKARPATDGDGLQEDAILTLAEFDSEVAVSRRGEGSVTVRSTVHDPLGEVPGLGQGAGRYVESDMTVRCRDLVRVDREAFLPYALGRMDDWSALDTVGTLRPPTP